MQVACQPGYPGFRPEIGKSLRFRVYLNGKLISRVVAADSIAGTVIVYRTDGAGHMMLSEDRRQLLTQTLHGQVRVEQI